MAEFEIIDRFGRRRKGRKGEVLKDGERTHFPLQFMDAATRDLVAAHGMLDSNGNIRTGSGASGHRRGYQFADSASPQSLHDAALAAYEARRTKLHYANRFQHRDDAQSRVATRDASQARTLADAAWEERKQRL